MSSISKIVILGSGLMGHGIAQISAMAGYRVALRDVEKSYLDKGMDRIKWSLDKLVEKQKLTQTDADRIYGRIDPVLDLRDALFDADLLIEAVPEDMNLKRKVYEEVDKYADSKTVYASNTSTLPITEIGALTSRPEHFVGLHFFNPPQLMQLVEVIPGQATSQSTTDLAINFIQKLGKQPILCHKDVVGFIVNRIFIPLVHEAVYSQERNGISMTRIDSAVKFKLLFPMGIFELADYTGLDVVYKATVEMHSRDKTVINPHPIIKQLFDEGKLGQKSGRGFYDYRGENYERIKLSPEEGAKYDPIDLLSVAANNASWLISNNVCDRVNLERALKLGMGLKGDLFLTVEKVGINKVIQNLNQMADKFGSFYKPNEYLLNYATK